MIQIKEVKTRKELNAFINFPLELFRDVPQFSPYIYEDEVVNLTPSKNPASAWCDFKFFLAYIDGKVVGRIAGIISHYANDKYNEKRVRFNRIDMIDDLNVTKALITAVGAWGTERGMNEIVGPLGYSDQDKEGLLVDGFDEMNMFVTFYHFPYYKEHLKALGFIEDAAWVEHKIIVPKTLDPRYKKIADYVARKQNVRLRTFRRKKELKPFIREALSLMNRAYYHLYGYVPISESLMDTLGAQYYPLINPRHLHIVVDENDKMVAFGLAIPSPVHALKKIKGRLFPFGFVRFLRALKKSNHLDMLLVAIEPELKNSGIMNIVIYEALKNAIEAGIVFAETGPQLEDNTQVQNLWKRFEHKQHKRRVCYVRPIEWTKL